MPMGQKYPFSRTRIRFPCLFLSLPALLIEGKLGRSSLVRHLLVIVTPAAPRCSCVPIALIKKRRCTTIVCHANLLLALALAPAVVLALVLMLPQRLRPSNCRCMVRLRRANSRTSPFERYAGGTHTCVCVCVCVRVAVCVCDNQSCASNLQCDARTSASHPLPCNVFTKRPGGGGG